jgi:hypothetical protein
MCFALTQVIAIDQDPSNTAGDRIQNHTDGSQVWARNLANGDKAVVLFNGGRKGTAPSVGVTWIELGWVGGTRLITSFVLLEISLIGVCARARVVARV